MPGKILSYYNKISDLYVVRDQDFSEFIDLQRGLRQIIRNRISFKYVLRGNDLPS